MKSREDENNIENLVNRLSTSNEVQVVDAACTLINLMKGDDEIRILVDKKGGTEILLKLLECKSVNIKASAAGALINLSINSIAAKSIIGFNGITIVLDLIKDPNPEIIEQGAGILTNLLLNCDDDVRASINREGGTLLLIRCLKDKRGNVRVRAAGALANLTISFEIETFKLDDVDTLMSTLDDEKVEVVENSLAILTNLTVNSNVDFRLLEGVDDYIRKLKRLVEDTAGHLRAMAIGVLVNLSAVYGPEKVISVIPNDINLLIALLNDTDVEIIEKGTALLNLSVCNEDIRNLINMKDLIDILVKLLKDNRGCIRLNASGALSSLAQSNDLKKEIANTDDCISKLLELLQDKDSDVKARAALTIGYLSHHDEVFDKLLSKEVIQPLIELLKDDNLEVKRNVVAALGFLTNCLKVASGNDQNDRQNEFQILFGNKSSIELFINLLGAEDPEVRLNSAVVLNNLAYRFGDEILKSDNFFDILRKIVKKDNERMEIRECVLWMLDKLGDRSEKLNSLKQAYYIRTISDDSLNLAQSCDLKKEIANTDDCVSKLLPLLMDTNSDVRARAALTIGYLSHHDEVFDKLLSKEVIQPLIELLKDDNLEVKRNVVAALGFLSNCLKVASGNDQNDRQNEFQILFVNKSSIELFINLLVAEDPEVRLNSAVVLNNLAYRFGDEILKSDNFFDILRKIVKKDNERMEIRECVLWMLDKLGDRSEKLNSLKQAYYIRTISDNSLESANAPINHKGLREFFDEYITSAIHFLTNNDDAEVIEKGATMLMNISARNNDIRVLISKKGAIPKLVNLLKYERDCIIIRLNALGALSNLAQSYDLKKEIASTDDCISKLLELLQDKDSDVKARAALTIGYLSHHDEVFDKLLSKEVIQPLIELLNDDTLEVKRNVVAALGFLSERIKDGNCNETKDRQNKIQILFGDLNFILFFGRLVNLLDDEDSSVRVNSAVVLNNLANQFGDKILKTEHFTDIVNEILVKRDAGMKTRELILSMLDKLSRHNTFKANEKLIVSLMNLCSDSTLRSISIRILASLSMIKESRKQITEAINCDIFVELLRCADTEIRKNIDTISRNLNDDDCGSDISKFNSVMLHYHTQNNFLKRH